MQHNQQRIDDKDDDMATLPLQGYPPHAYSQPPASGGAGPSPFLQHPQFQLPPFMYTGAPALAPGGGAEVVPPGGSTWMQNSGFNVGAFVGMGSSNRGLDGSPGQTTTTITYSPTTGNPSRATLTINYPSDEAGPSPGYSSSLQKALDETQMTSIGPSPEQYIEHPPPPAPFDYDSRASSGKPVSPSDQHAHLPTNFMAPSALGLPLYSTSGFDLLSVFGRVANRPNPSIKLGPVDLTSSFVVVDVRRFDHPIVYCSPTFCRLTGYEEKEILAKNCRFLQAPPSMHPVNKNDDRKWTSLDAVRHMKKSLVANKEVQASLVNYRKDGSAFINLVTIIPVPEENGEPVYQLGFQVDLTEQPNAILDRLRDGTYMSAPPAGDLHGMARKTSAIPPIIVSKDLILPTTTEDSHPIAVALMSSSPDFFLVVSLKGLFLYVAPAIAHVLGYTPNDLVNKSLGDIAHPADVVPLMRELKDSSGPGERPRSVDLPFRAKTRDGKWVWLECRGRLHVEPGKGRKAIVLTGRVKEVGGLEAPLGAGVCGMVTKTGTILGATADIAGYGRDEVIGRPLASLFARPLIEGAPGGLQKLPISRKDGSTGDVELRIWKQTGSDELARVWQIIDPTMPQPTGPSETFNVFEELSMDRDTSWQYELQQLRFENQRLQEQIRGLEDTSTASATTYTGTPTLSSASGHAFSPQRGFRALSPPKFGGGSSTFAPSPPTFGGGSSQYSGPSTSSQFTDTPSQAFGGFSSSLEDAFPVSMPMWYGMSYGSGAGPPQQPTTGMKRSWDGGT